MLACWKPIYEAQGFPAKNIYALIASYAQLVPTRPVVCQLAQCTYWHQVKDPDVFMSFKPGSIPGIGGLQARWNVASPNEAPTHAPHAAWCQTSVVENVAASRYSAAIDTILICTAPLIGKRSFAMAGACHKPQPACHCVMYVPQMTG